MRVVEPNNVKGVVDYETMNSPTALRTNLKLPGLDRPQLLIIHPWRIDEAIRFNGIRKIYDVPMFIIVLV